MKKLIIFVTLVLLTLVSYGQVTNKDIEIRKTTPVLKLNGTGAIINFYNGDVTITHSSNKITVAGGNVQVPQLILPGSTSGTTTLKAPAVAGAAVVTLPATTGTIARTEDVNDSIAARLAAAIPAIAIEDTIGGGGDDLIPGIGYLRSYVPSSTSIARRRLDFTVDVTTGAPTSSDSTLDHSYLIGKDFDVYRSGVLQGENFTATNTDEGFRFNNTLGRVTVNPLWQANERVIIDCFDPVVGITYLALEGEESDLETDLLAYFTMDDNGDQLVDQLGYCNINKYNTPTNQQEGKINYAWLYDGEPGNDNHRKLDTTYFNYADAFSVSMWIKSSATNSDGSIVGKADGGPPVNGWTVEVHSTNVTAEMWDGGVEKAVTSSTDCSDQTWHHIVMTYDGEINLYIDGSADGTPIAAPYGYGTYSYFGISRTLAAYWNGYIDNIGFWHKELSAAEVLELYTAENAGVGYPW